MTESKVSQETPAIASGMFSIAGDLPVYRMGFGAMRLTGRGIWGPPASEEEAIALLQRVIDLGINFIDTADSYGPYVSEELIAKALFPYPEDLVIATKGGLERPGPNQWELNGDPNHLRLACEGSLKRLKREYIDLYQLHRIDPKVSLADQIGILGELQREGKIKHIGLSEVTVAEIKQVQDLIKVASVQNEYNLLEKQSEPVLKYCTQENIAFIPWYPLATGSLTTAEASLAKIAEKVKATPAQVALAWLLEKSPVMLPIPGTSNIKHLEENTAAALLKLDADMMYELNNLA